MNSKYNFYYKAPAEFITESLALFARMTVQPTQKQKLVINDTIKALKNAGIWDLLDVFVMLYSHDIQSAYLNWKQTAYIGSPTNSPIFTPYSGVVSSTTKYINSNFIPNVHAYNYSLNSATIGVYTNSNTQNAGVDIGRNVGGALSSVLQTRSLTNLFQVVINNVITGVNIANTTANDSSGLTCSSLLNNVVNLYKNGINAFNKAYTASALQTNSITVGQNVSRNYQFYFIGASLTNQQHADLYSIITNYLNLYTNE